MKITRLNVPQCSVGEGPLWDVATQALFWIDIVGKGVFRFDPVTGETRRWPVPDIIGSMATTADGNAIVALANGVHALDFAAYSFGSVFGEVSDAQLSRIADYLEKN